MPTLKSESMSSNSPVAPNGDASFSPPSTPTDQIAAMAEQISALREQLSHVTRREAELRAVLERESELDAHLDRLAKVLRKTNMGERVTAAIEGAALRLEPFPYTVIDDLLPQVFYDSLLMGLPPVELFESKPLGKQHLDLPFDMALHVRRTGAQGHLHGPDRQVPGTARRLDRHELAEHRPRIGRAARQWRANHAAQTWLPHSAAS
jgi:hypothetical protein